MSSRTLFLAVCAVLVASAFGSAVCKNPKVVTEYFTTGDATIVSHIALIGEFTVSCADPNADGLPLFAEIEGRLTPIARIDTNKYQVSWTEETLTSSRGSRYVRLFDEEGFGAVRKAQRSGGDITSIPALATVNVYHSGAFSGPWINSEILAAVLAAAVAYIAFSTKSKLLS